MYRIGTLSILLVTGEITRIIGKQVPFALVGQLTIMQVNLNAHTVPSLYKLYLRKTTTLFAYSVF